MESPACNSPSAMAAQMPRTTWVRLPAGGSVSASETVRAADDDVGVARHQRELLGGIPSREADEALDLAQLSELLWVDCVGDAVEHAKPAISRDGVCLDLGVT